MLPSATEAEMKNGVAYKNKNVYVLRESLKQTFLHKINTKKS